MSCNGCRILRKGCNENCILRQSLQGIESPQAQANATVFVAKFFGRAGLMSFLSSVLESQRPALFQSLLFEACGRTVNPVNGALGLLWTGNWQLCQAAVDTVLRGGVLRPMTDKTPPTDAEDASAASNVHISRLKDLMVNSRPKRNGVDDKAGHLGLNMTSPFPARMTTAGGRVKRRAPSPEESETTTSESCFEYNYQNLEDGQEKKLLRLFF